MSFYDLGLNPTLADNAHALGLTEPSAIQEEAIPVVLDGRDLLGCAPTGSGKTLSYLLPLLQRWMVDTRARPHTGFVRPLHTLIVVPTRELALQVHDSLCDLTYGLRNEPRSRVVYGGVSINPQMMQMRGGADFLIATPGRLLDLHDHNAVRLKQVGHVVLDEADRLLDPSFAQEMNELLDLLPTQRQTLLFSATFPAHVEDFVAHELHRPVRLQVDTDAEASHASSPDSIVQRALAVDSTRRAQLLRQLIEGAGALLQQTSPMQPPAADAKNAESAEANDASAPLSPSPALDAMSDAANSEQGVDADALTAADAADASEAPTDIHTDSDADQAGGNWDRVLVFVAKRYTAEVLADKLYGKGIKATTFHGELSQGARNTVLAEFKAKRWQVLITTDLAARGIDIAKLPVVVNYDLPRSAADYVHRIGRTGRAGQTGLAISLVTPADAAHWALIQKRNQLKLALESVPGYATTEVAPPAPVTDGNGGVKGRRLSKKDKLRMAQAQGEAPKP